MREPFIGVSETWKVVDWPDTTVCESGLTDALKSPAVSISNQN
jgi:hypothetical protein